MHITFISFQGAVITALFLTLSICIYFWKIRPFLIQMDQLEGFHKLADGFWRRIWEWLKIRWGLFWAAVIAATPIVWNGGLDTLIAINIAISNGSLDLSWLIMPPWLKSLIQLGSVFLPILQAIRVKRITP